ncbi:MAG: flagellar basal body-associated FliL family protein [Alphaproteobacteria bacterium]
MAKILPILIVLIGLVAGVGAGIFLRPAPTEMASCEVTETDGHDAVEAECEPEEKADEHAEAPSEDNGSNMDPSNVQYVKLSNQFVVPVVKDNAVAAMVVISLSIETTPAMADTVYLLEPKLRDGLLRVMFLHANSGGFEGQFTRGESMKDLRGSLLETARVILGPLVSDVLITDILRQDV